MKETAIYVHIPFCDHKCIYCDFYSIITSDNISAYKEALLKEIEHYAELHSTDREIISIFFGGGTPSLMAPEYIAEILNSLKSKFSVLADAEITLETNPGTVDEQKLIDFKKAGINRISIGIQSFHKAELDFMTRIHDPETAIRTVENASKIGFDNISIDLIFNLPGQTKEMWRDNLKKAMALPITHISPYSLILENGTILNKMVLDGKVELQDKDYDADLYETTISFLAEHGFQQYEVSNFCKPGFESVHNNAYWHYKDYLSFGTSSHSFLNGVRWKNASSLKHYINLVEANNHAAISEEILTKEQMLEEYVMLAMRSNGLSTLSLTEKFGHEWLEINSEFINLLTENDLITHSGGRICFTPKGYAICDEILAKFQ
ncbi:MAG: radical SAM family heme chaperone HemW [Bacteroidetes bacterium]|nr:radical SAM family heme chaperone HemW [Bacteroidota bacterium]